MPILGKDDENAPGLLHHDGGELVVLHAAIVEVLVMVLPLVVPEGNRGKEDGNGEI